MRAATSLVLPKTAPARRASMKIRQQHRKATDLGYSKLAGVEPRLPQCPLREAAYAPGHLQYRPRPVDDGTRATATDARQAQIQYRRKARFRRNSSSQATRRAVRLP